MFDRLKKRVKQEIAKLGQDLQSPPEQQNIQTKLAFNTILWSIKADPVRFIKRVGIRNNRLVGGELLLEAFYTLNVQQGKELANFALELPDEDLAAQILFNLSVLLPESLTGLYERFLERKYINKYYELFRTADRQTRDKIIELLNNYTVKSGLDTYDLLIALAWVGDEVVIQKFKEWEQTSPNWRSLIPSVNVSSIGLSVGDYTKVAGWEITENNQRHNLYFDESYVLNWVETTALPVSLEPCGWCNTPLVALFDFDLKDTKLWFLGLEGERLIIPICKKCSYLNSTLFAHIDYTGKVEWSGATTKPEEIAEEIIEVWPQKRLVLGNRRRSPFETIGYLSVKLTGIGGYPTWYQDDKYPECPECHAAMVFIAQFDEDPAPYGDGIFYAFICKSCQMVATNYQCT